MAAPTFVWSGPDRPQAIVVAIHGLKGSAGVFAAPAARWVRHGIVTYACSLDIPDARPEQVNDLIRQVSARHPGLPLIVVGESLGASLAIMALSRTDAPAVDALVLSAPAIWPDAVSAAMIQNGLGWLWHIADSRSATFWDKVITQMDAARDRAPSLRIKTVLILTGDKDEVVPRRGVEILAEMLAGHADLRTIPEGGHTLFRDAGGDTVADQVANWLEQRTLPRVAASETR